MNNVQVLAVRGQKKAKRRHLLLDVTREMIAKKGLRSLKIRDIAEAAGCSIGSIYNEFGDFDGVILTISRDTVQALNARLSMVPNERPVEHLHGLAEAYLSYYIEHPNLVRALFEHRMENDRPFPEDLLKTVMEMFCRMYPSLQRLLPKRKPEDVALLASTMFSAVHGIISLGLEERLIGVPVQCLRQQVNQFIDTHLAGMGALKDSKRPKATSKKTNS